MIISKDVLEETSKLYRDEYKELAYAAALAAARGHGKWTRIETTMEFAKLMKYKKLGIASCVGLARESAILERILKANGFQVVSAICKTGGIPVEHLGIRDDEKAHPGEFHAMCNPLAQAALLDSAGSQLNILMGLCVGHDALFYKASKAPVTTLVAKDVVLGHNPAAAIYNHESYYKRLYPK